MSSRLKITLPDEANARLVEIAAERGEPVARVAAEMLRDGLANFIAAAVQNGTTPSQEMVKLTTAARANGGTTEDEDELPTARAPWLEPYGGDRTWRQLMWGSILALYERYPNALKGLKVGWWNDEAHVEMLCALAHWRQMLDDGGTDPRQELDFQFSIIEYGRRLKEAGGGVTTEWKPGVAPDEWH
ncbi:MAG TPA: hypothetical protein VFW38_04135 [Solirubrobacteraceae bacterium]|nr:hypothetical protein [Solirubrobacteraceae bacterium]